MSKEQSTRMFNEYANGIIRWTNGLGVTVAQIDLRRIPTADGHTVADAVEAVGPETIAGRAMIHGLTQKVGDAAALGIENGRRPTWEMKSAAMQEVIESLYAGEWNQKRSGSTMLYEALQRLAAKGSAKAAKYAAEFVGLDDETRKALMKAQAVRDEIDKIRAERNPAPEGLIDDL